ncbi:MAG: carbon-nitrogen hydrolase family protein [Planctomycetes bacterium]|nr:carbon-nitrogen hydrolase family protein [Planctomycetota bacterium]
MAKTQGREPQAGMLRVAAFQFKGSARIAENQEAIIHGMRTAASRKAKLLALQECALTGYAGVEIASPLEIDRDLLRQATAEIAKEAKRLGLYVSLGTTVFDKESAYNALRLLGPTGRTLGIYHKRAMYDQDGKHYTPGTRHGIHTIAGIKAGLRICFEFRFPEYFRELFAKRVQLAVMGFNMVGQTAAKLELARSLLRARAAENNLWILTANSISAVQNGPTCLVAPDGQIVAEAPAGNEALITGTVTLCKPTPLQQRIREIADSLAKPNKRPIKKSKE